MAHLHWLEFEVRGVVRQNRYWMTWNLLLAAMPAALSAVLFRPQRRRNALWWVGVVIFLAFLPNAPYVASDLKWLHPAVVDAASRSVVVTGVLPLFAAYVGLGFLFYWFAVRAIVGEAGRRWPEVRSGWVIAAVHLFCAFGVLVGRVARLNSWTAFTSPGATVHRSVDALATPAAPVQLGVALAAITLGYATVGLLVAGARAAIARLSSLRPPFLRPGESTPAA